MKKLMTMVMAFMMVFSLAACGSSNSADSADTDSDSAVITGGDENTWGPDTETEGTDVIEVPSPITQYETLEEAISAAGFDLVVPDLLDGFTDRTISVYEMDVNMIQVIYSADETSVTIRKEAMDEDKTEDISGVYIEYENTNEVEQNGIAVTLKGSEELIYVANWTNGDFNYSIYANDGMEQADVMALISRIQ